MAKLPDVNFEHTPAQSKTAQRLRGEHHQHHHHHEHVKHEQVHHHMHHHAMPEVEFGGGAKKGRAKKTKMPKGGSKSLLPEM
jgi:hypothetical protein